MSEGEEAHSPSASERLTASDPKLGELKSRALHLKPMLRVSHEGITGSWLKAMQEALDLHGLVKVKFVARKEEKKELAREIEEKSGAILVQRVGFVATYYRAPRGARNIQHSTPNTQRPR
jgi:RNA-binding protein